MLLHRDPIGVSEVVNDLDGDLQNFWRVLQGGPQFDSFMRVVQAIPFSEAEFRKACSRDPHYDVPFKLIRPVTRAIAFFVRCRQSLAGRMEDFAPLTRNRLRRNMNEQASAWLTCVEGLPAVHARLKRVVILDRDAIDVIRQQDGKDTLYYADPPYVKATRAKGSTEVFAYEMTDEHHVKLVAALSKIKGKAIVSMYRHPIYDVLVDEHGWHRIDIEIDNKAAGGKTKRKMVESLFCNFKPKG